MMLSCSLQIIILTIPLSILSNYFFQATNFKFQNVLIKSSVQLCNISSKGNLKSLFYFFIIQTIKNKPFTKNIDQFKIPEFVLHIASIRDKFKTKVIIWNWIKIKRKKTFEIVGFNSKTLKLTDWNNLTKRANCIYSWLQIYNLLGSQTKNYSFTCQ